MVWPIRRVSASGATGFIPPLGPSSPAVQAHVSWGSRWTTTSPGSTTRGGPPLEPIGFDGARRGRRRRPRSRETVVEGGSGETDRYSWVETPQDVELRVKLPSRTSGKSVELHLTKTSISLSLIEQEEPIIHGTLRGPVSTENCHWTMEELESGQKMLYLCLEKTPDGEG
ncbi:unnamed protein product, partial [Discosporangium mesarthrocarpum]